MIIDGNCQFFGRDGIDRLLRTMDAGGIGKVLLSASIEGAVLAAGGQPLRGVGNRETADAVAAHPDRFVGCFHLDPRDANARGTVEEYAGRGFRAAKLFPAEGYYLDEPRFYDLFDLVQERGLAALVYCGQLTMSLSPDGGRRRALNSAWGYPMRVDAPSRLFPRIRWVILHMGFPFLFEAWSVHHANKNVWLDISGTGVLFDALPVGYAAVGGPAFIPLDFDKVVWGSDNAADPGAGRAVADAYLKLMGCTDDAQRARVFGPNAATLLGL